MKTKNGKVHDSVKEQIQVCIDDVMSSLEKLERDLLAALKSKQYELVGTKLKKKGAAR